MFNPFLQQMPDEKKPQGYAENQEFTAQIYGHSLDTSTPRPSVGLWVGRLLIRIGEKLTKQDSELHTLKEQS